jgi:hypothetical protein
MGLLCMWQHQRVVQKETVAEKDAEAFAMAIVESADSVLH